MPRLCGIIYIDNGRVLLLERDAVFSLFCSSFPGPSSQIPAPRYARPRGPAGEFDLGLIVVGGCIAPLDTPGYVASLLYIKKGERNQCNCIKFFLTFTFKSGILDLSMEERWKNE